MVNTSMDVFEWLRKRIEEAEPDMLREMVKTMAEKLMSAEADTMCGAEYRKRSEGRVNQRNGYRVRGWDTRVGTIDLGIPKLRHGSYFPHWLLEPRRRAEKALLAAVVESYVLGVSTRKVDKLVHALGVQGISKSQVSQLTKELDEHVERFRNRPLDAGPYPYVWLDAIVVRCREEGRVVNVAVVIAIGVNKDGHREVLGTDVFTSEDHDAWTVFLRSLVARGLSGVRLVISDAHEGLKGAIASVLPGSLWQRCRTHFARNVLVHVPKSAQDFVAAAIRSIFAQPTPEEVHAQHARVVAQLEGRFPKAAQILADAGPDILAFTAFPKEHWRQIWSNNPLERLNREMKRRTDVVGIFPNRAAVIRLVGAVLAEQHDEWAVARRYMSLGSLAKILDKEVPAQLEEGTKKKLNEAV